MSRPRRFVIEGEWSGYTAAQSHVVHRTVHGGAYKALRAWAEKTSAIGFNDGTQLFIKVRDCLPRERVQQVKGYQSLISDCARYGVSSVAEVMAIRQESRARSRT